MNVMVYNPRLQHQVDHANAWKQCGFHVTHAKHETTPDVAVISGPWYAYDEFKNHPRTLMIDRAWWGDPDCVSIGWLRPGSNKRKYASGTEPRPHPDYEPWKTREKTCLVLLGYGEKPPAFVDRLIERFDSVEIRKHPAESDKPQGSLTQAIATRDVVVCGHGTAGFEAIRQGVPVICYDLDSELAPVCALDWRDELYRGERDEWLHEMSYKQFTVAEIADGTAWNLLRDVQ